MRFTRREILKGSLAIGGASLLGGVGLLRETTARDIPVRVLGPSSAAGHKLRGGFRFPDPAEHRATDVLVVGGGIAGLSAAWRLRKRGHADFHLLEMESEVGGNSRSTGNAVSRYPWGAHYVTLLNDEATEARELFEDLGIIVGTRHGRPIYNEYYLCHAPQERLFMYGKWQEGIYPKLGNDESHSRAFFAKVEELRAAKGADGRHAFTIPIALGSRDPRFLALDRITLKQYLAEQGWTSKPLNWYVDYCCRDDYGTPAAQTSAWAGLHYFCSRRGRADGVEGSAVLTWPEGNGWIVDRLRERVAEHVVPNAMAYRVADDTVDVWDETRGRVVRWRAKAIILAVPRFIAARLLGEAPPRLEYAPWMVANVTLGTTPFGEGAPIAWDNVLYGGRSLGYVVATHQRAAIHTGKTVWTYYRPLDHLPPAAAREQAWKTPAAEWRRTIVDDLSAPHPGIADKIESIDVWIWGHAMPRPTPGFLAGPPLPDRRGRVHFAHSDLSGISIFEEANYRGVKAADAVMERGFV